MPRVSILMPAKNAAPFIGACIRSVIEQLFTDWELIIVDDFSSDETCTIAGSFHDPRIRVITNHKPGIIPALDRAFQLAGGTYITRMDADDRMPPDKLQRFVQALNGDLRQVVTGKVRYFADGVISGGYRRYEDWLNSLVDNNDHFANIYRECVIASPNWMVHRACFEQHIPFSELRYPEDYDLVFHWYQKGYRISGVDAITHFWREHEARTSRHHEAYQQSAFFRLKTHRFVDLETLPGERLQLVGAGVKGKLVAAILQERQVDFDWFDFDAADRKMIRMSRLILPLVQLKPGNKTILTVWPADELKQEEIRRFFTDREFRFGENAWLF